MTKSELKEKLLSLDIFIDDKYLDEYINLIIQNLSTSKIEYQTQKHHIIPKSYYIHNKLPIDNSQTNTVFLSKENHIYAHGLLFLCGKDWFAVKNYWATIYLLGKKHLTKADLQDIFHSQDTFLDYVNKVDTVYVFTDEHKSKISKAMKGNKAILGRVALYDTEGHKRFVLPELVDKLISEGYTRPTNKKKVPVEDQNPHQLHTYQRRSSSEDVHKHLSESHLGHIPSNKGVPCSDEKRKKLADSIRGRKWINNGIIQKQVKPEDLDYFLSQGFISGQLKRR